MSPALAVRTRRSRRIRTSVATVMVCAFIALFATIYLQMLAGRDPALGASVTRKVQHAAASGAVSLTAATRRRETQAREHRLALRRARRHAAARARARARSRARARARARALASSTPTPAATAAPAATAVPTAVATAVPTAVATAAPTAAPVKTAQS
jgi:hypothetical protein